MGGELTAVVLLLLFCLYCYAIYWSYKPELPPEKRTSFSNRFPFRYYSSRWRVRLPRFRFDDEAETCAAIDDQYLHHRVCDQCCKIIGNSGLLLGSWYIFTPMCEWHDLHRSFRDLEHSASTFCHLCTLMLCAVSTVNRLAMAYEDLMPLKLKIWQERPLGSFVSIALFRDNTQVSARLKITKHVYTATEHTAGTGSIQSTLNTGSVVHFRQIEHWMEQCTSRHLFHCRGERIKSLRMPTRLLKLDRLGTQDWIRLCVVDENEGNTRYAALSHCWGKERIFTLNRETSDSMQRGILSSQLPDNFPKNFRHAIDICLRLNLSYLWIDSLCIFQDSKEDWKQESAKMGDVYAGAYLTIAATGAISGSVGCYRDRNPLGLYACRISGTSGSGLYVSPVDPDTEIEVKETEWWQSSPEKETKEWQKSWERISFERGVVDSPLNKRAWVFQERLLSPRIIHFATNSLYWECQTLTASGVSEGIRIRSS